METTLNKNDLDFISTHYDFWKKGALTLKDIELLEKSDVTIEKWLNIYRRVFMIQKIDSTDPEEMKRLTAQINTCVLLLNSLKKFDKLRLEYLNMLAQQENE